MAVVVVVGVQWGDEGKGKIVDLLTEKARFVVRWAGGANAGHTLVVDGKKYVTRLIPSGILRDGVTCVLGEGMVIDPAVLVDEIRTFRGHGFIKSEKDLVVAERAHLTLPHHKEIDRLREEGPGSIGTTKKGIGPTYESKAARIGLRVGDLLRPERFRARLERTSRPSGPTSASWAAPRRSPRRSPPSTWRSPRRFARTWATPRAPFTTRWCGATTSSSKARRAFCSTSTTGPIRS